LDYLSPNLEILARRQPELAAAVRAAAFGRIELLASRKGLPTAYYHRVAGGTVPLHSRYDPMQEARRILDGNKTGEADYFVLLGFGLGYPLDALMERVAPDAIHTFVVESDLEILRAAFSARDLTQWLSRSHIHFAWPVSGNGLARQWEAFFDPVHAKKCAFLAHPPSLALNPIVFQSAVDLIQGKILQVFTDINTLVGKTQAFLANFAANFTLVSATPGVHGFAGQFAGVPAVLVAAGPSLDRNIHELRPFADRALILAADTALKPLLAGGIHPHFIFSADPGQQNYLHLKGADAPGSWLVAEATAYPDTWQAFRGRTIACAFENSSLPFLSEVFASKGTLRAWGSVATMCLDFGLLAGCDPVIFAGQDLAFSDGGMYCTGLQWDKRWFAEVCAPEDWERRCAELRAANRIVMAEDLFGSPVASTDKLTAYWTWFSEEIEKHPQTRFINATEGGILKNHVEIMSLREALHRFCGCRRDLRGEIRRLLADDSRKCPPTDFSSLRALQAELALLTEILEEGIHLCDHPAPAVPIHKVRKDLERVKESIYGLTKLAPLLDCFNQMGIVRFLRRCASLTSPHAKPDVMELKDTYLEYFRSMDLASGIIREGLSSLPCF
jgi:hypothetical protein